MKTDKEKIAEIICRVTHKALLSHCDMQCDVMCIQYAEELVKQGYHKTTWHKVADGDLPPEDTFARCVLEWCGIKYYAAGYYNSKTGWCFPDNANSDARLIAWAYMPEYEE